MDSRWSDSDDEARVFSWDRPRTSQKANSSSSPHVLVKDPEVSDSDPVPALPEKAGDHQRGVRVAERSGSGVEWSGKWLGFGPGYG